MQDQADIVRLRVVGHPGRIRDHILAVRAAQRECTRRPALVYDQLKNLPDGSERLQLFDEATKLLVAYVPYRMGVHRIYTDLAYPELVGYKRPPFSLGWWQYVDVMTKESP